ncbi:MAG: BrnA antitoxin family protein [Terracidiphilus sp.]
MANRKPLIDEDGEVREITAKDVALFKPFSALPKAEQKMLLKLRKRGPQKAPRKVPISIRLSPDVAEGLRATGNGWQGRADEALRSWLEESRKGRQNHA